MTIKVTEAEITFNVSDFEAESVDAAHDLLGEVGELIEDFMYKVQYKNIQVEEQGNTFHCDPPAEDREPVVFKVERKNILESLNLFGVKK